MRWLFMLLVVLNVFCYIWHQQGAPLKAKEVVSLSLYKGSQQGIRLLSEETQPVLISAAQAEHEDSEGCLYLLGGSSEDAMRRVQRRLADIDIQAELIDPEQASLTGYMLRIAPESQSRLTDMVFQGLANEFNELKYKKMRCRGLQLPNSLHRMAPAPQ